MKSYKQLILEVTGLHDLRPHPVDSMTHESEPGLDWEYNKEFKEYCREFPKAFDSREHFGEKYKTAEVRHRTPDEHSRLGYSTHASYVPQQHGETRLGDVERDMGHRRDVGRIAKTIESGKTAYPIVLKHSRGLRILAGNTRMSVGASMGKSLPVKIIDISDRH